MNSITFEDYGLVITHMDDASKEHNSIEKYFTLFKAIDVLTGSQGLEEGQACLLIQSTVEHLVPVNDQLNLIHSDDAIRLARVEPHIIDHKILQSNKSKPEVDHRDPCFRHKKFQHNLVSRNLSTISTTNSLISVLCLLRNNIAHGYKAPRGSDLDRLERDNFISETCYPLLSKLLQLLLNHPTRRLLTYGTLQPGGVHARLLASIQQNPSIVTVRGTIKEVDGLRYFSPKHKKPDTDITCHLYESDALIALWSELDRFEGSRYQRQLVPYKTADGELGAGYIYAGTGRLAPALD
jgi:gamma-glutamylcyclotransferase (GGCT)/AIG2-like uncharacterized protein YtfP